MSSLHRPATAALVTVVLRLHLCALHTATAQQSLCLAVEDENDCEALSSFACEHEAWQTVREGGCTVERLCDQNVPECSEDDDDGTVLCCVDDHGIGAGGVAALVAVVVVCVACLIHGIVQSGKGEAAGVQVKVAPKNGFAAVAAPVTASELACMPVAAAAIVAAQPVTAAQLSGMPVATATRSNRRQPTPRD
eukprot:COSAG04_NODE_2775_length_3601_cov_2.652484_5_plen_193_part_00